MKGGGGEPVNLTSEQIAVATLVLNEVQRVRKLRVCINAIDHQRRYIRPAAFTCDCIYLLLADDVICKVLLLLIWLRLYNTLCADNSRLIVQRSQRARFRLVCNRQLYNSFNSQLHHPNLFYFRLNSIEAHLSCERLRVLHAFITN